MPSRAKIRANAISSARLTCVKSFALPGCAVRNPIPGQLGRSESYNTQARTHRQRLAAVWWKIQFATLKEESLRSAEGKWKFFTNFSSHPGLAHIVGTTKWRGHRWTEPVTCYARAVVTDDRSMSLLLCFFFFHLFLARCLLISVWSRRKFSPIYQNDTRRQHSASGLGGGGQAGPFIARSSSLANLVIEARTRRTRLMNGDQSRRSPASVRGVLMGYKVGLNFDFIFVNNYKHVLFG